MTVLAVACVWASSWAYSWRMARVWRAGPSVWSVQFLGVPLIRKDARSKWPMLAAAFWQVWGELDVVDQRLGGGQRAGRQLDRGDGGVAGPVVDVVL
jgi:hypothetical protein